MTDAVIRWTVGDVHPAGFRALRLSILGAWRLFGPGADYVVCVNSVPVDAARRRTGAVPDQVSWRSVTRDELAPFLRPHLDAGLAEGVGWKFVPFCAGHGRAELALDNDCILWRMPAALRRWAGEPGRHTRVLAEDVRSCFGQFTALCGGQPRNSGIRALPPRFDLEGRMRTVLSRVPAVMSSELDEQGLQVAALSLDGDPDLVRLEEVSICSPFRPHLPEPGRCGAHFVGLNARSLPWAYYDRPAVECIQEHWAKWEPVVARLVAAG